jgi:eukaryotic-like serine/threonine-protein kinase
VLSRRAVRTLPHSSIALSRRFLIDDLSFRAGITLASPLRTSPTPSEPDAAPPASQQATVCAPLADEDDERTENTDTAPRPYAAGVVISQKYELIRMLGEGGMGAVWVARNVALDAHIGLKLIRAEVSRSVPGVEGRLLQEARAAASLGHPAIIRVFDFGISERGDPFIAMELLHGESLADVLQRRGKVGAVRAVQTLLPIIDALAAAHASGIVHRDLKPDNIFISREAGGRLQPKVLDFGIAKLEHNVLPHLTREGTVLGSPAYMSPEQARGHLDVDARSDIWALSVVFYQLVTGRLPFAAQNSNALLWSIVEKPPVPFVELGVTEPELWSIVARGLAKDRAARWQEMFDFGKALAEWLLARGVEDDICDAGLRRWLEPKGNKGGDGLHSIFPSDLPVEVKTPNLPQGISTARHDSSSGVRVASSAPAPIAVTQVALETLEAAPPRRPLPRWVLPALALVVAALVAALARSALRRDSQASEASTPRTQPTHVQAPVTAPALRHAPSAENSPSEANSPPPPAAPSSTHVADAPSASSAPSQRGTQDRAKPIRKSAPKRKSNELKDPFR